MSETPKRRKADGFLASVDLGSGPPPRPSRNEPATTKHSPTVEAQTIDDTVLVPIGVQLKDTQIERIKSIAHQEGLYQQIAFIELLEEQFATLGPNPTLPPPQRKRGPAHSPSLRLYSSRIPRGLQKAIDQLAETSPHGNRSVAVRYLLDKSTEKNQI